LPFSIPVDEADLPPFDIDARTIRYDRWHGWWHLAREGTAAAFPFGFGLTYCNISVHDVTVEHDGKDRIIVRGQIRNAGDRNGGEVIQVYVDLPDPDAPSRLAGFARVGVPAHSTAGFELVIPTIQLATRDPVAHAWKPPVGSHAVRVGRHAADADAVTIGIEL
jgi:beta-glucosidase